MSNAASSAYAPGGTLVRLHGDLPRGGLLRAGHVAAAGRNLTRRPRSAVGDEERSLDNPDDLIRAPEPASSRVGSPRHEHAEVGDGGALRATTSTTSAPSIGVGVGSRAATARASSAATTGMAYDRINTFVFSSAIFQSIPGITTERRQHRVRHGRRPADGRPADPAADGPARPTSLSRRDRVVEQHAGGRSGLPVAGDARLGDQLPARAVSTGTLFEVAYVGRRAEHLFGAYNVNQAEIFSNGFLEAFNAVKAGGESALMNQLLAPHSSKRASETGSQRVRQPVRVVAGAELRRRPGGDLRQRASRAARRCPSSPGSGRISSSRIRSSWAAVQRDRLERLFAVPRACRLKLERRFRQRLQLARRLHGRLSWAGCRRQRVGRF